MPFPSKHGLNQYRLNYAKSYAQGFADAVSKIEVMYQLSQEGMIDEEKAENYISANIKEIERNLEYFKEYIRQREDMR